MQNQQLVAKDPQTAGWRPWFAWRSLKVCGRWRWLAYVLRSGRIGNPEWLYKAGRTHDWSDAKRSYADFTGIM